VKLSQRVTNLAESATLAVSSRAAELRRAGVDVISFGAGEPDFDTPAHIKDAAKQALDAGHTAYAKPTYGIPEAREAVCRKFSRDNGLTYSSDQVIVTVGGKEALFLAFAALVDPGDEVVIPAPYWVSFPEQVRLCGGTPVIVAPEPGGALRLRPEQIAEAVTPKTKIVLLNSPSNPGGFAYSPEETQAIAAALRGRDVVVFSDEMYDRLRYGERREHLSFAAIDRWFDRTVTFNAASKTYAMTGWRVGYAAGPAAIIRAMAKLQSQTTSGTATFIQHALVTALMGDQRPAEGMRDAFERRGLHLCERLNALPGVTCSRPDGAFYCFPDVSGTFERLGVTSSGAFAAKVLEHAHVALVPGGAFGMDLHVRLSFAADLKTIDTGIDRIARLLETGG